jgi:molecular chaperone GrpE
MSSLKKKKGRKEKAKDETKDLKDQLARALADYDNLRKRVEKQSEEIFKIANVKLVARLLPVFDMFEEAQKHAKDSGIAIALNELEEVLKEEGIEKIQLDLKDEFDENLAEVVDTVKTKKSEDEGKIAEVVLTGWKVSEGPVIRPAKVKVYKN